MTYRFATLKENYEDYSSGRVFYGSPGATGFPVRLASEIFQRCAARLTASGIEPPYTVYDPCCGGGYSATIIGYLHGDKLEKIYASDVSPEAIELAKRNLALLQPSGLNERITEIRGLIERFQKQSHINALESSLRLKTKLDRRRPIPAKCFRFDILSNDDLAREVQKVDLVQTDLPYGQVASWRGLTDVDTPRAQKLLINIRPVLKSTSIVAITTSKTEAVSYDGYRRLEHTKIGKRRLLILEPTGL